MPDRTYDFESGTAPEPLVINDSAFQIRTDQAFNSTYSIGIDTNPGTEPAAEWIEPEMASGRGTLLQKLDFHYYETGSQSGSSVNIYDADGKRVCGWRSENPQWVFFTDSGHQEVYGGDSTEHWIHVIMTLDWDSKTFDYDVTDTVSGTNKTGTLNMNTASALDGCASVAFENGSSYWIDDLVIGLPTFTKVKGTVTKDGVGVKRAIHIYDTNYNHILETASDASGAYSAEFLNLSEHDVYILVVGEQSASERAVIHGPVTPEVV